MKKIHITSILLIILFSMPLLGHGQQPDSTRTKSITYLGQYLRTDTVTARGVNEIQESYKNALRQVVANQSLSEQQKRTAIDGLIDEKNRKLEQLLGPLQRAKIIPTTERRKAWRTDTTARKTY